MDFVYSPMFILHCHGAKPQVRLSKAQIERAIPLVAEGLEKYRWIQANRLNRDLHADLEFRGRFNHFYRVRRNRVWQDAFYKLLETKKFMKASFAEALDSLRGKCQRIEASYVSKLVATIDPTKPVLDRFVLRNVGLRLPHSSSESRIESVNQVYSELGGEIEAFLESVQGRYLVQRFTEQYPSANVTEVKMVDFILWQTRPQRN